ncbi:MAG: SRPBCC family protein [Anaerolineales bacterium]|nr:SRPBCC family protein [Anaerolineales bacterium]
MTGTDLNKLLQSVGGAGLIGLHLLLGPLLRGRRARWGATESEVGAALPGDEFVLAPKWGYTRAVTIQAPVERVWPWLVQIGQGRGGFYSYESLENLVGCDLHNTGQILPAFQTLQVGDGIRLHPQSPPLTVRLIEPGRYFVLHGDARLDGAGPAPDDFVSMTWGFYLEPTEDEATRFLTRGRYDYSRKNRWLYGPAIVEPIGFIMERKMMLETSRIVENAARIPNLGDDADEHCP